MARRAGHGDRVVRDRHHRRGGGIDPPPPQLAQLSADLGIADADWTPRADATTALHVVQTTIETFVKTFADGGFMPAHRDAFNATIAARLEGIRDYIVAHYRLARRADTIYWRDATRHDRLSDSLKAVMTCWFTGGDLPAEIARQDIARYYDYAPSSWGCLLAGYGVFPDPKAPGPALADYTAFLSRCAGNFASHSVALAQLRAAP